MKKESNGICYHYIDPSGNITALVESYTEPAEYEASARLIMQDDPSVEQVGYILSSDKCDIRLYMAAGEFCGNAVMSTAAFFCDSSSAAIGDVRNVLVEASGCREPVEVNITRGADQNGSHVYNGSVRMPRPKRIFEHTFEYGGTSRDLPVVEFDGIKHIIAANGLDLSDEDMIKAIKKWCGDIGAECLGIMLCEISADGADDVIAGTIRPLVYAPSVGTCVWENSCASGTTAYAAYMLKDCGQEATVSAKEPGGTLRVTKTEDNDLILSGTVRI